MQSSRPPYPISIVAEILAVHPETVRIWEKSGIIKPQRRSGKRFYSETDLKRLHFIKRLMSERLNLPAIRHYLKLYPCWEMEVCPSCMKVTRDSSCAKPCWREEGAFCQVYGNPGLCARCEYYKTRTGETA